MNFRQLDCFLSVASSLSFSKAGKMLFLSQSAVSKQVSMLEAELGYPLFYRDKHHVSLTPAGEHLYIRLVEIRDTFDNVIKYSSMIASKGAKRISVGYDGPIAEAWIGRALAIASSELDVTFNLRREPLPQLTNLLIDGSVDVIITTDSEMGGIGEACFHPLVTSGPCAFFSHNHNFEEKASITLKDLEGESLVTAYETFATKILSRTGSILLEQGISIRNAIPCADGDTAFMAAQTGMGVFIASHLCDEYAKRFAVHSADLEANLPLVTMGVAWRKDDEDIRSFARIAELALAGTVSPGRASSAGRQPTEFHRLPILEAHPGHDNHRYTT